MGTRQLHIPTQRGPGSTHPREGCSSEEYDFPGRMKPATNKQAQLALCGSGCDTVPVWLVQNAFWGHVLEGAGERGQHACKSQTRKAVQRRRAKNGQDAAGSLWHHRCQREDEATGCTTRPWEATVGPRVPQTTECHSEQCTLTNRVSKLRRHAKIAELDLAARVDEDVRRLHVLRGVDHSEGAGRGQEPPTTLARWNPQHKLTRCTLRSCLR